MVGEVIGAPCVVVAWVGVVGVWVVVGEELVAPDVLGTLVELVAPGVVWDVVGSGEELEVPWDVPWLVPGVVTVGAPVLVVAPP